MKKILFAAIAIFSFVSCNQPSELPPIEDGYATTFVLPDPVDLTSAEREFIKSLEAEYKEAISNDKQNQ